ncbi:MAG: DUF4384 domain-containing protein [Armatimonadetes bacterium]|nr:DUF4384 domain-containing protein [Armatimonadota bacterium]
MALAQVSVCLFLAWPWIIGQVADGLADDEVGLLREIQRQATLGDLALTVVGRRTAFREGEEIKFEVSCRRDMYVTLLDFGTSGGIVVVLPNRYSGPVLVRAGQRRLVPANEDGFRYLVSGPPGTEHVVAIGSVEPIRGLEEIISRTSKAAGPFGIVPTGQQRGFVISVRDILVVPAAQPARMPYAFAKCSFVVLGPQTTPTPPTLQQSPQPAPGQPSAPQLPPGQPPPSHAPPGQPSPPPMLPGGPSAPPPGTQANPPQPGEPSASQPGLQAPPEPEPALPAPEPPLLAGAPQPGRANRWAVALGISRYRDRRLLFAAADAKLFADKAAELLNVPKEHIVLLTDAQATCDAVRDAFARISKRADRRDRLYVFFSGHGVRLQDDDGDEADSFDEALLLQDAPLRDDEFYLLCNQTWCTERVLFLDCCYAGGAARGIKGIGEPPEANLLPLLDHFDFGEKPPSVGTRDLEETAGAPGQVVLAASKPDQVSWEDRRIRHGVFTYYVSKGLAGDADEDRNGVILVEELYAFLRHTIPNHVAQMPGVQQTMVQEPVLVGRPLPGMRIRP